MTLRKYKKNRLSLPSVSQSNFWVFFGLKKTYWSKKIWHPKIFEDIQQWPEEEKKAQVYVVYLVLQVFKGTKFY